MPLLHTICTLDSTEEIRERMSTLEGGGPLVLTSLDGERSYEISKNDEDVYSIVTRRRHLGTRQMVVEGSRGTTRSELETFLLEKSHYTSGKE